MTYLRRIPSTTEGLDRFAFPHVPDTSWVTKHEMIQVHVEIRRRGSIFAELFPKYMALTKIISSKNNYVDTIDDITLPGAVHCGDYSDAGHSPDSIAIPESNVSCEIGGNTYPDSTDIHQQIRSIDVDATVGVASSDTFSSDSTDASTTTGDIPDDNVTEASADGIAPAGSDGSNIIDADTIPGSVPVDPYHVVTIVTHVGCECGSVLHVSQNKTQFMYNV